MVFSNRKANVHKSRRIFYFLLVNLQQKSNAVLPMRKYSVERSILFYLFVKKNSIIAKKHSLMLSNYTSVLPIPRVLSDVKF